MSESIKAKKPVCKCHVHTRVKKSKLYTAPASWRLTNKDMHLTGCPVLIATGAAGLSA